MLLYRDEFLNCLEFVKWVGKFHTTFTNEVISSATHGLISYQQNGHTKFQIKDFLYISKGKRQAIGFPRSNPFQKPTLLLTFIVTFPGQHTYSRDFQVLKLTPCQKANETKLLNPFSHPAHCTILFWYYYHVVGLRSLIFDVEIFK